MTPSLPLSEEATMPNVRIARERDAAALANLLERTFRETFEASNNASDVNLHCQTNYTEAIQAAEIVNPAMTTLVCEHEEQLIGVVQLHWGDTPSCVTAERPGEIQRFYVDKAWQGLGVARALMNEALIVLRSKGVDQAWLGVWEHNPRARAFYGKFGFTEVGEHVFMVGLDPQRDVVMTLAIE